MRRTVYLSFDLSKAEERACYLFLVNSDRAKKKIICTLLANSGLINPKIIITDEELPKLKKEQKTGQKKANQSVQEVVTEVSKIMVRSEIEKTVDMASNVIIPTFPDGTPVNETKKDNPYSMFIEEQLISMQQKGIDYEVLKPIQLKVLADRLNEGYPYKAALMEAQFTQ
ncbi:hypothetical protein [Anaerocolumna xylanovorans]|uniref:Uncharacterized protein n=1 Tax=Anaerocolumna xylanovorans DSM 12503 TaxID=1121345 RepID=A0A1M7YLB6_9FIRM|nr:hypothetical protein [Anaerocolumna xylanovorans]SHO53396.1 hypothetical protein SAMN02745217_04103 [Anaerocolumna xylanovorans DSM 12503]